MGEHPRICSLVAGVFNSRPQLPKYCFILNAQTVIDFVKSKWGQNGDLSDKYLTYLTNNIVGSDLRIPGVRFTTFRY